jgi:anthranilate synthase component 1
MQALSDTGANRSSQGCPCIVREVPQPPDLLCLHAQYPRQYPHLLQSAAQGRFDILFAYPGQSLALDAAGMLYGRVAEPATNDFLAALDDWWSEHCVTGCDNTGLPFTGGWFVYLGYELAGQIEPRLRLPSAADNMPVALATRFASAIVRDNASGQTVIVAEPGQEDRVAEIERDIHRLPLETIPEDAGPCRFDVTETSPKNYRQAVSLILDYIRDGDVFQVNLSREWQVTADRSIDTAALYRRLMQYNPSPFGGMACWDNVAIVSSSPERLVRVQGRSVETRPIAGTRPRSNDAAADDAWAQELMSHPKEQAEHIMLIDLERNDLGRICRPGTVQVDEFMVLESYTHVHHIVSNIRGELREDVAPGQVIRAVFPGGTITGCPKVRCMEIIAELEQAPRGAYTGSMGYINRDGSMDLNILIRTMVVAGDRIRLRAGAGIVADSVPEAELDETRAKARGLLRALGMEDA